MRSMAASAGIAATLLNGVAALEAQERMRYVGERAIVEFEPGALTPDEMEGFARLVERGISDLESLVLSGPRQQRRQTDPIRYVITDRARISTTFGRTVYLPLSRVRARAAPYLHETVHVLLPTRHDCVWLAEGLACYLESWVSENMGGYDAQVFSRAGDRGIHRAAAELLAAAEARVVLPFVGRRGEPPSMLAERRRVARPFYVLSHSLSKYLVEREGLDRVVALVADGDPLAALARATGHPTEWWRREWLEAIGAGDLGDLGFEPVGEVLEDSPRVRMRSLELPSPLCGGGVGSGGR